MGQKLRGGDMTSLEFMVPKAETEAFNTAVYRFLELRLNTVTDDVMMLKTEPMGPVDRKTVTLWSAPAMQDFTAYWSSFRRTVSRP
jgi:hypothetical protein